MIQQQVQRPLPGVLFGITHSIDGAPIIREPKILKVGIGLPRGPAVNVWLAPDNKWKVRVGYKQGEGKTASFDTREQAESAYREQLPKAPVCGYPRKIGFFTFTRPVLQQDGTEIFEPDFGAIEEHGIMPTEIDIVLMDENPFSGSFQMWSTSELKCRGDGVTAMRVVTMAPPEFQESANQAAAIGEKYFAMSPCWTNGCPFAKEANGKPSLCKPGGDLKFQLAKNPRVGGTAYFHTTGYRSISNIFSSLSRIVQLAEFVGTSIVGVSVKMVLRPYKTVHNGQTATQYGVSLEFRAQDVESLKKKLIEQAWSFRKLSPPPVKMIEAPTEVDTETDDEELPLGAAAMAAEFYPEAVDAQQDDDAQPTTPPPSAVAAAATAAKTDTLSDKLRAKRERAAAMQAIAQPNVPATAAPQPALAQPGPAVNVPVAPQPAAPQPAASMATAEIGDLF